MAYNGNYARRPTRGPGGPPQHRRASGGQPAWKKPLPKTQDGIPSPSLMKMRKMSDEGLKRHLDTLRAEVEAKRERAGRVAPDKSVRLHKEIQHCSLLIVEAERMLNQREP